MEHLIITNKKMDTNYRIEKYDQSYYDIWNSFLPDTKNATFLFHRDFMEYHKDRFEDFSLLLYKKEQLIALFPANWVDEKLHSHQGLSYGGMLLHNQCNFKDHHELYYQLLQYIHNQNISELFLKKIPLVYHRSVSEESNLLFFWSQAKLLRADIYSYLDMADKPQLNRNRQRALKRAVNKNIRVEESDAYEMFWNTILIPNLKRRFAVKPTHTVEEIKGLNKRFPDFIKLFVAYDDTTMEAGAVVFVMDDIVHFQYSSGGENRTKNGALDILFNTIIEHFAEKKYITFGTSSNKENNTINQGLLSWKESYGAHHVTQRFYRIKTENFKCLEERFI